MKLKFWPLLVIALMWACGDDSNPDPTVQEPQGKKLLFQTYDVESDDYDNWIILSDDNGTVLDYKKLGDNTNYTFVAPTGFEADVVNLTFVYNRFVKADSEKKLNSTVLTTYTDVPFGAYNGDIPSKKAPDTKQLGYVEIDGFVNSYQDTRYRVSTPPFGSVSYEFEQYDKARIHLRDTTDRSGIMIMSAAAPFSYLYTEIDGNGSHPRSMTDFQAANIQQVQTPPDWSSYLSVTLNGVNKRGLFAYYKRSSVQVESDKISVPYAQDVFDSYEGHYSGSSGGDMYEYYFSGVAVPPAAMSPLNAKIEYALTGNTLSWETQGTIDLAWVRAVFISVELHTLYWDVYGPAAERTTLPVIPAGIPSIGGPEGKYDTFQDVAANGSTEAGITEFEDFAGYKEFIIDGYLKTGKSPKTTGYRKRLGR